MRAVDNAAEAVSRFASRLMDSPALRALPALLKEEQALNVLRSNGPQLVPVFASLGLDTRRGWREPAAAVVKAVKATADAMLETEIADCLSDRLELSFLAGMSGPKQAPPRSREELRGLVARTAKHPVARRALAGSLAASRSDIIEKYVPRAFERKKYMYVELAKVQRLALAPSQLTDLVRFVVLLRPAAYLFLTPGESVDREAGFSPLQEQYLSKILPGVSSAVPSLPGSLIALGLRSALAFPGAGGVEATSRLGAIMALRGRALGPAVVVDRGADTPDKSWFNVQRRNARWHGLDADMLDELHLIASENGW